MAQSRLDIIINTMRRGDSVRAVQSDYQSLQSTALEVAGALGVVAGAASTAYAAIKRGAELGATRDRFENLAESIGTTSDALLGELTPAINGMLTQAETMQIATQLMSLGLANSTEEVVRMARAASALNMDMNQLVLTLTNQTTMRFDALGISVDGFEERVRALEAAGHDANEAFKLAFLEQAEEQMILLGDAADTTAGHIQQVENRWRDLGNAILEGLGTVANPVEFGSTDAELAADAYTAMGDAVRSLNSGPLATFIQNIETILNLLPGVEVDLTGSAAAADAAAAETEQYNATLIHMAQTGQLAGDAQGYLSGMLSGMPAAAADAAAAGHAAGQAYAWAAEQMRIYASQVAAAGGDRSLRAQSGGFATTDPSRFFAAAGNAYWRNNYGPGSGFDNMSAGFGGYTSAADEATQATQRFNSALMSMLSTIEAGGTATDPIEAMFQAAANAGANLQDVIDLGVAAGHAREDMEAAARAVAEQQMAQRLGEQVARGAMTTEEALAELAEFQNALDTGQASLEDMASGNVLDLDYSAASAAVTEIRTIVAEAEAMSQRTFSLNVQTVVDGVASGSGMNAAQRAARRAGAA